MSKVTITINTDNAAFEDALDYEVIRCLSQVRAFDGEIQTVSGDGKIRDSNGNTVGKVEVE